MMLLSVIIPAYNFENYIVECVRSVTSQNTNFDLEILVRDDHSGDNTNILLRKEFSNDPRVIIFESSENLGAFGNIKYLLENSGINFSKIVVFPIPEWPAIPNTFIQNLPFSLKRLVIKLNAD